MVLLAQINLSQMPSEVQETLELGEAGLLQVWMCHDCDCESWEPFAASHLVRVVPAASLDRARDRSGVVSLYPDGQYSTSQDDIYTERPVTGLVRREDFPKGPEVGDILRQAGTEGADREALEEHCNERQFGDDRANDVYIGGWFNWLQDVTFPGCPECSDPMTGTVTV
ncbi:protein of unknown function DUF1963 [Kipferlia bialata]|uniref:Uncharacterized protein n=1 Tax=Kipferlia bialata TaxID=797122 RepID=A0A9K3CSK9_9EUKA|nr:protein of unknown function DUF1963 [Kipferlia bialata]|eukprot:g3638.t1